MTTVNFVDDTSTGQGTFSSDTPAAPSEPTSTAQVIQYAKRSAKNGRTMYFKDGRLTREAEIPEGVMIVDLDTLPTETPKEPEEAETVEAPPTPAATVKTATDDRQCPWGDSVGTKRKFINGKIVYLCDYHYANRTLGEIVQQLRVSDGPGEQRQAL